MDRSTLHSSAREDDPWALVLQGESAMDPVMRIVLAIVGAFAGATLGSAGSRFFDTLIGAFAGFAIAW